MPLSNLTAYTNILENSAATPGLFDTRFQAADANIRAVDTMLSVVSSTISGSGVLYNVITQGKATANGVADDSAKFTAAIASATTAGLEVPSGTYQLASAITLSKLHKFHRGAMLRSGSGITTYVNSQIDAGDYQIFDYSLGGYDFSRNTLQKFFRTAWFGVLADGGTSDTTAINRAINACYGPPDARNGVSGVASNRRLVFGPGTHVIDNLLNLDVLYGFHIQGDARQATTLSLQTTKAPIFRMDSAAYGVISNINFQYDLSTKGTAPLVELDWTGTHVGTLKPQQISFDDCTFNGNFFGPYGVRIAYSGGNAQGDTILFKNCLWLSCTHSGLCIGDPFFINSPAFNALGIKLEGGNIQSCYQYGILCYGGQVLVDGTSFQNQNTAGTQLDGGGADVCIPTFSGPSVIKDVRSESNVLLIADSSSAGVHLGGGIEVRSANVIAWVANSHVLQGAFYANTGASTAKDGRAYRAWSTGTTGGSEPLWGVAGAGTPIYSRKFTVTSGSSLLTNPDGPFVPSSVGWGLIVPGAGPGGSTLYTSIVRYDFQSQVAMAVSASSSITAGAATARSGPLVTDSSVTWMAYDYNAVEAPIETWIGGKVQYGRFRPVTSFPRVMMGVKFARKDWWNDANLYNYVPTAFRKASMVAGCAVGDGDADLSDVSYAISTSADSYPAPTSITLFGSPLIFGGGDSSTAYPDVGFDRGDGYPFAFMGSDQGHTRNVIHVIGTLGKRVASGADSAGTDLQIQGGIPTGTGAPGGIDFRIQTLPGVAGTGISTASVMLRLDSASGVSFLPSVATLNLNQNRLVSLKTTGTSLSSTNVAANELALYIGGASGASIGVRSGTTIYFFSSSLSTVG